MTKNVAVNFQYLQFQAENLKFVWSCHKDKADLQNPDNTLVFRFQNCICI